MQTREWKSLEHDTKVIRIEIDVFEYDSDIFDTRITVYKQTAVDFDKGIISWQPATIGLHSVSDMVEDEAAKFAQALYKAMSMAAVLDHEYPAGTES